MVRWPLSGRPLKRRAGLRRTSGVGARKLEMDQVHFLKCAEG